MKPNTKVPLVNRRLVQPHNAYNIYFMLERHKLIEEMEGLCGTAAVQHHRQISYNLAGYDFLTLPDLPPRFQNLQLPLGWFVPGKNSKRKHRKTHGLTSFAELARTVAANWKSDDYETKAYCVEVARILKERHTELTKVGGVGCLSTIDSGGPESTEKAKPRNVDNETQDTHLTELGAVFCLPAMDSVSPCPTNETNQRKGMCGPDSISPVAREQGTVNWQDNVPNRQSGTHVPNIITLVTHEQGFMNNCEKNRTSMLDSYQQYQNNKAASMGWNDSHDHSNVKMLQPMSSMHNEYQHDRVTTILNANTMWGDNTMHSRDSNRTWLTDMSHQYQHNQIATIPIATTIWSNESLNCTTINMLQPMPSDVIQDMQLMTGSTRSQTGTYHQEAQQKYRAVMNASRRASIANMMTLLPGRARMPEGIRCVGEQPSPNNRAPECQSFKERHAELTTPTINPSRKGTPFFYPR